MPGHYRSERAWLPARHLLYGKGKGIYRIIFDIREDEQHVRVLRVWHASRDAITAANVVD
jgi:plasmid stabilization system protein ParE